MALNKKVLQDIKKSFKDAHLDIKIYWILTTSLWNSTTVIHHTNTQVVGYPPPSGNIP